jgi:hypothetical protein
VPGIGAELATAGVVLAVFAALLAHERRLSTIEIRLEAIERIERMLSDFVKGS